MHFGLSAACSLIFSPAPNSGRRTLPRWILSFSKVTKMLKTLETRRHKHAHACGGHFYFQFFLFCPRLNKSIYYAMSWEWEGRGKGGGMAWKALTLLFLLFFCTVGEDWLEQAGGGPLSWKGTTKLERDHLLEGGQDLLAGGGPRLAACCLASTVHWREFLYQRVLEIFFSKLMKIQCSLPDRRLAHQGHGLWTWKNCCIWFRSPQSDHFCRWSQNGIRTKEQTVLLYSQRTDHVRLLH